jgi:hypothetical protein
VCRDEEMSCHCIGITSDLFFCIIIIIIILMPADGITTILAAATFRTKVFARAWVCEQCQALTFAGGGIITIEVDTDPGFSRPSVPHSRWFFERDKLSADEG